MTHRALKVSRGRADRDPMFAPVWYDGTELLVTRSEPVTPDPVELPPIDPAAVKWEWALARANEVNAVLCKDADFSGLMLVGVVHDLVDTQPTADDIIAEYRRRMKDKLYYG